MASEVKRCTQCGMLKDIEQFRPYTYSKSKGTHGRFRICRSCESVNSTYQRVCKQLQSMSDHLTNANVGLWDANMRAKEEIEHMYDLLDAHGFRTPRRLLCNDELSAPTSTAVDSAIKQLTAFYAEPSSPAVRSVAEPNDVPEELQDWLNADPAEWVEKDLSPEYLQETIYESLKAKYRPQTGVDRETYLPIYDDTYKGVLNQILRKFDDYEETYAGESEADDA